MSLENLSLYGLIRATIDICLVWFVLYKAIMLLRGTKAIQLLRGIFVVIVIYMISYFLKLQTIQLIIEQIIVWGPIAIIILFQPEIRKALEQIGRGSFFSSNRKTEEELFKDMLDALVKSMYYMAKRRIGALIAIERRTNLGEYIETGVKINGELTHQLLTNIFMPNAPLHDGAVVLRENNIVAASCYLPLSESTFIAKELGTRHRAAMGLSELTDALTLIVSEETGHVSVTINGKLYRDLDEERLTDLITKSLVTNKKEQTSTFKLPRLGREKK